MTATLKAAVLPLNYSRRRYRLIPNNNNYRPIPMSDFIIDEILSSFSIPSTSEQVTNCFISSINNYLDVLVPNKFIFYS